jgi:hypothetical protein
MMVKIGMIVSSFLKIKQKKKKGWCGGSFVTPYFKKYCRGS